MKFADWMSGEDVHGRCDPPAGEAQVRHLTCDSREAGPGWAFAALRGERKDGADYVPSALALGAAAILCDRDLDLPEAVPFARLGDGRRTLALLARKLYGEPDRALALIGVTGTNGKTTTTTLVRQLMRGAGLGCGLMGTVVNAAGGHEEEALRTTPESPVFYRWLRASADAGDAALAAEVSSHSLVLDRVHGARFKVGVFTNLTQDHLDFHGDMETYFQAKARLFRQCERALVNADDPYGQRLLAEQGGLRTYAIDRPADYRIAGLALSPTGTGFRLTAPDRVRDVRSPLLGRFNAYNLLAALAALAEAGFDLDRVLEAVPGVTGAPGRLDRVDCGQPFGVLVDYAHTPDALEKLLAEGRRLLPPGGRLHVLFGCGGDRDRAKRPGMAGAVAAGADVVWHTSDNARLEDPERILDDGARGLPGDLLRDPARYRRITDRALAVAAAVADCRPGDLLLLAGKGHEPYLDLGGVKYPFSDRAAVEAVLGGRPVPRPWAGADAAAGPCRSTAWSLRQVQGMVGGTLAGDGDVAPAALSMDTRTLRPGDAFVAIRAARDGHAFAPEAVAKGACALLVDHELALDVPQLVVPDTLEGLQRWGQARLAAFRPRVVLAVTGSLGKTSTKELLAGATGAWRTPGNRNNLLGLPEALATLPEGLDAVVLEMGMSTPGEIRRLAEIAPPDFGMITNIGVVHMEFFPEGQQGIARAKGELVEALPVGGAWVHPADDPWCRWVALQPWARARAVAVGPGLPFGWEEEVSLGLLGERFLLRHPGGAETVRLRLRGAHHVRNAALAGTLAILAGFEPGAVAAGLGLAEPLAGRGRLHALRGGGWLLDESYNAVMDSVLACAATLLTLDGGPAVAVLGCMRELGPAAESLHRQTGEGLRALGLQRLLAYGTEARALAQGFGPGAQAYPDFETLRDDPGGLGTLSGDARILVKGSLYWRAARVVDWLLERLAGEVRA
jgi:UDP-N-acetylmuramyl-tripeptide synthetase/UDP-N-acetylmuramoyl-tripeptide--D-alanyl-D-alanine ligase